MTEYVYHQPNMESIDLSCSATAIAHPPNVPSREVILMNYFSAGLKRQGVGSEP